MINSDACSAILRLAHSPALRARTGLSAEMAAACLPLARELFGRTRSAVALLKGMPASIAYRTCHRFTCFITAISLRILRTDTYHGQWVCFLGVIPFCCRWQIRISHCFWYNVRNNCYMLFLDCRRFRALSVPRCTYALLNKLWISTRLFW